MENKNDYCPSHKEFEKQIDQKIEEKSDLVEAKFREWMQLSDKNQAASNRLMEETIVEHIMDLKNMIRNFNERNSEDINRLTEKDKQLTQRMLGLETRWHTFMKKFRGGEVLLEEQTQ